MSSVIHPALLRPGTVSHTLVIRNSARRIAHKLNAEPSFVERLAVDAYRESGNPHEGKRALHRFADSTQAAMRSGGGLRA